MPNKVQPQVESRKSLHLDLKGTGKVQQVEPKIKVHIKRLGGDSFDLDVKSSDTVQKVMSDVTKYPGVDAKTKTINLDGKRLNKNQTLSSYDIWNGSKLDVNFK